MNFCEITVPGPAETVTRPSYSSYVPFAFAGPVQTAYALVQSFHLEISGSDSEVENVAVVLTTHFDSLQSATSGEVEVEFQRTASPGSVWVKPRRIVAQIRILVVGL